MRLNKVFFDIQMSWSSKVIPGLALTYMGSATTAVSGFGLWLSSALVPPVPEFFPRE